MRSVNVIVVTGFLTYLTELETALAKIYLTKSRLCNSKLVLQ